MTSPKRSPYGNPDSYLEIAMGNVPGKTGVNKWGTTTNADAGVATDVWDRANATDDQDIITLPTQARIHQIASDSTSDDGSPAGVGARTLRVSGLVDWVQSEITEVITLNGTTDVPTTNAYVIIHRLEVLTKGATNVNVGTITATADIDGTVSAQIQPGEGQTKMAILGIPSTQTEYMVAITTGIIGAGVGKELRTNLLVNPEPGDELTNFVVKHSFPYVNVGTSHMPHNFQTLFPDSGSSSR